jgi:hypothetical protein
VLFTSVRGVRKPDRPTRPDPAATSTGMTSRPPGSARPLLLDRRVEADRTQRFWRFTAATPPWCCPRSSRWGITRGSKPGRWSSTCSVHRRRSRWRTSRPARSPWRRPGVGRSIEGAPDGTVVFVRRETARGAPGSTLLTVYALDPMTTSVTRLVSAPPGATEADLAWTRDGLLLVASGTAGARGRGVQAGGRSLGPGPSRDYARR